MNYNRPLESYRRTRNGAKIQKKYETSTESTENKDYGAFLTSLTTKSCTRACRHFPKNSLGVRPVNRLKRRVK